MRFIREGGEEMVKIVIKNDGSYLRLVAQLKSYDEHVISIHLSSGRTISGRIWIEDGRKFIAKVPILSTREKIINYHGKNIESVEIGGF